MIPEGSLPRSQQPATFPCLEPDQSSPCPTSHFLKIHLNIILQSNLWSSKWSLSLTIPQQNPPSAKCLSEDIAPRNLNNETRHSKPKPLHPGTWVGPRASLDTVTKITISCSCQQSYRVPWSPIPMAGDDTNEHKLLLSVYSFFHLQLNELCKRDQSACH
jgi:hypothetical protein